jgi:outer membrane protein OmpA-like peptidoglycan-associated protein
MNTPAAPTAGCLSAPMAMKAPRALTALTALAAALSLASLLALAPLPAGAQAAGPATAGTPSVQQMIEALKPQPSRSRNLLVRPAEPVAATEAAAPQGAAEAPADGPAGLSLAVPFDTNSAQLQPASGAVLGELVAALLSPELQDTRFIIEGHTDARGNAAANLRLSQQRAESVRQFLIALGVQPTRLRAVGKGSSEPLDPARPDAAENRRVRVVPQP